jgi:choline dehydrogenase-like flavoprotein
VDCVVGSGPAGVACASALLKRGRQVHLVDGGVRLEADREAAVRELGLLPPKSWTDEHLQFLQGPLDVGQSEKLRFGSDYAYREAEEHLGIVNNGAGIRPSLAFGGLSTVWGAAMLPYLAGDLVNWPVTVEELAPHYAAVVEMTGLCAAQDDLTQLFPLFSIPDSLEPSRQALAMWRVLSEHRERLRKAGIFYGRARLAVKSRSAAEGCRYCGMCMYGCPYQLIYSSEQTIKRLIDRENFAYQPDFIVTSVEEVARSVHVRGYHRVTRKRSVIKADRVFLAAGAVSTTRIVLRSASAYNRQFRMKDSQYFLIPVALRERLRDIRHDRLHTLAQIFLEIFDDRISKHCIHLQVYTFSDLIHQLIRKSLGRFSKFADLVRHSLDDRLMLIQGYLHSSHSGEIEVSLVREQNVEHLHLEAVINEETRRVVHKILAKLLRNCYFLGVFPAPIVHITAPGRGYHAGGTFPMMSKPDQFETDTLGRLPGWNRVHIVDATIFPSIAATTITFTVMANAHRIGATA